MYNTYCCKCGYEFEKNTDANVTALKLEENFEKRYEKGHACYGCPFASVQTVWNRFEDSEPKEIYICYGAKKESIEHLTIADSYSSSGSNLKIHTNDFDFIGEVFEVYSRELELKSGDYTLFKTLDDPQGRCTFSLSFPKNALGEKCKKDIIDAFFTLIPEEEHSAFHKYRRTDYLTGEEEFNKVKERIQRLKMRSKDEIKRTMYYNPGDDLVYLVKETSPGKFRIHTAGSVKQAENDDACFPVFRFATESSFEKAQAQLDVYAKVLNFEPVSEEESGPKKCVTGFSPSGICACCGKDGVNCCISCNEDCNGRCGWIEEHEEEIKVSANEAKPGQGIKDASFKSPVFDKIFDEADTEFKKALRILFETKEKFDFTIKFSFFLNGGLLQNRYEIGYKFEPINYKRKDISEDEFEILIDENENIFLRDISASQMTIYD